MVAAYSIVYCEVGTASEPRLPKLSQPFCREQEAEAHARRIHEAFNSNGHGMALMVWVLPEPLARAFFDGLTACGGLGDRYQRPGGNGRHHKMKSQPQQPQMVHIEASETGWDDD